MVSKSGYNIKFLLFSELSLNDIFPGKCPLMQAWPTLAGITYCTNSAGKVSSAGTVHHLSVTSVIYRYYIFLFLSFSSCFQSCNVLVNFLLAQRIYKIRARAHQQESCCRNDTSNIVDSVYNFCIKSCSFGISDHCQKSAGKS